MTYPWEKIYNSLNLVEEIVSACSHLYRDSVLLVSTTHKDTRTDATK